MPDTFSILSPAGFIMEVDVVPPQNGPGTHGRNIVSTLLPGANVQVRGVGEHTLQTPRGFSLSGRVGTMQIDCSAGAQGVDQAVAFLRAGSLYLGVAVDAINRPYALIYDQFGNLAGKSAIFTPPPVPEGQNLEITLAWDVENVVYFGRHAGFQYNDWVALWYTNVPPWTPFQPTSLMVGTTFGQLALADFAGTIDRVQVGNEVIWDIAPGASIEVAEQHQGQALMPGDSSWIAVPSLILGADSTMAGDSTASGTATVAYEGAATMAGDSSVTPGAGVTYQVDSTMAGDSSVAADIDIYDEIDLTLNGDSSVAAAADVALAGGSNMPGDSGFTANATVT